jgi:hypothetical protein
MLHNTRRKLATVIYHLVMTSNIQKILIFDAFLNRQTNLIDECFMYYLKHAYNWVFKWRKNDPSYEFIGEVIVKIIIV